MHGTHDSDPNTLANDSDELDPGDAARLLDQAERDARRQFNLRARRGPRRAWAA